MKKLSIIIVTYNSENDIYDCIESIRRHSDIPLNEIELIIVDNNSKNPASIMFKQVHELWGEEIITIQNSQNGGYGQGNNIGIKHSSAPFVLIINPDVRLIEPIFKTAIEAFETDTHLGIYGIKQMLTATKQSTNSFACTYMMNGYLATFLTAICSRADFYIQKFMYITGACFFLNKEMFTKIGMFDETNFLYGEEDDIHYRFIKNIPQVKMRYNKHLHFIHLINERKPNLQYEKKIICSAIKQNYKNGYPPLKTLKSRLANTEILLLREKIRIALGKKDKEEYELLKKKKEYITGEIQKIK